MEKFAKLFEDEEIGQVLVVLNISEPDVRVNFMVPALEALGTQVVHFDDNDKGEKAARRLFDQIEKDEAVKIARLVIAEIGDE